MSAPRDGGGHPPSPAAALTAGHACYDRWAEDGDPADLAAAIRYARAGLAAAAEAEGGSAGAGSGLDPLLVPQLHELLGVTLLDRAEDSPDRVPADLTECIVQLEAALAAARRAGRARLHALLAHACWLRLDGDARKYGEVDQLIEHAAQAWRLQVPADEIPGLVAFYLVLALHERLSRPGQPFSLDDVNLALEVLAVAELPDAELQLHLVALHGMFLVARGQYARSAADLHAAQPLLLAAADRLPADDPQFAAVTQVVAVSMSLLAGLGLGIADLDQVIPVLQKSVGNPRPEREYAATTRASLGTALVSRSALTHSAAELDDGITHLVAAYRMLPDGNINRIPMAFDLGSALLNRFVRTGDLRDRDAARFYLDVVTDPRDASRAEVRDLVWELDVTVAAMRGLLRLAEGLPADAAALDDAVQYLRAALDMLSPGHPLETRIRSDLGLALTLRGSASGRGADFREADRELRRLVGQLPPGHPMRGLWLLRLSGSQLGVAYTARDPALTRAATRILAQMLDETGPEPGLRVRALALLGGAHQFLHELTADPADLAAAADWLGRAVFECDAQPGHPEHANSLSRLAQVHRSRGDPAAARAAGLAALRARGREVLLQTGTAHGLRSARLAASEAAEIAAWCLADDQAATAVDALELGRGLVLHAVTSGTDLPALLTQAGRADLAAEWQAESASRRDRPWDTGLSGAEHAGRLIDGEMPLEAPDALRARALTALAGSAEQKLLSPPASAHIAAALARTGADALVYLLAPAGCAILIPAATLAAGARPQVLPLPGLRGSAGELASYVTAYAEVLALPAPPAGDAEDERWRDRRGRAVERWRQALSALCRWAWPAAVGPVLARAATWGLGRLPRLVLIPAGQLSLVPWHAALAPPAGAGHPRYACAEAVISYAASGRQLIQASRRPALDLRSAPVIVGNPTFDLPYAGLEAAAIREQCYPSSRYLGHASPITATTAAGPGLPSEVLGLLPAASRPGASMIHLGCHADVTGSAPGRSYLLLAGGQKLMIEAILRQASGRPAGAAGGLVTLAACRSDLAAEEHDEALTLATAFLAAGAVTVVGARWEVPDSTTSLLMFMFHHFMTADQAGPRDALRMAQLWMLDPDRAAPPDMPDYLASSAARPDLSDVVAWAALTHQGK